MSWIYSITKTYNTVFEYEEPPSTVKPFKIPKHSNTIGEIYVNDVARKISVVYVPIKESEVEVYYIVNGEYFGVCVKKILYWDETLLVVADGCGASKKVRIIQLHGVKSLKSICRNVILKHMGMDAVSSLCLPKLVKDYLLYKS